MIDIVNETESTKSRQNIFLKGLVGGIGWAFGVTIGFAIISTILAVILKSLGGLPLIGKFLADLVDVTLNNLSKRTVF